MSSGTLSHRETALSPDRRSSLSPPTSSTNTSGPSNLSFHEISISVPGEDTNHPVSPTPRSADSAGLLGGNPDVPKLAGDDPFAAAGNFCPCFQLRNYQPYFNVTTNDVATRVRKVIMPVGLTEDFRQGLVSNPDLWGPFWFATTLIWAIAASGNVALYFNYLTKSKDTNISEQRFNYDFSLIGTAAALYYGYIGIMPMLSWGVSLMFAFSLRPIVAVCVFGYSLLPFIPAVVLCMLPIYSSLQWILILGAGGLSAKFIHGNLAPIALMYIPVHRAQALMGLFAASHITLVILTKVLFF